MSKYYQQLQKNYKNIITQKMYSKNLINRVYFQKYIIAFNFLDFEKKSFKEIISKANLKTTYIPKWYSKKEDQQPL